ncbi:glycosyltransferase involved in cell wall biosynthesis [Novosphingobium sp. PhB165]|uniref:glycosyltransferase family 4 protein n=1 Tax=Novosphingobium sp. PhB165 TaxID=2485105 RepID=UPI0010EAF3B9|nr:glycosyltransferase family 4 protein [Novosphingobium sp. PhB165]TCM14426.1 glycosyltransferase involved in cell wall biosynthesis [Novosphingobium sp. PhB165]
MPKPDNSSFNVAVIGTFAPRKCGIATFTEDLKTKVETFCPGTTFDVYALDRRDAAPLYGDRVNIISVDEAQSYRDAARQINRSGVDAVWLQHEYGIFGGADGVLVTELVDRIEVPLIVTFHTILSQPSADQRGILGHILARTDQAMVMSEHGRSLLIELYGVSPDRITVIPHGAPDRPFGREEGFKSRLGVAGRPVLMTFGLLGPGKGLEHAIEALPAITANHPDVLYRIVGATHPNLVREHGEAYRKLLETRVLALGVEDNVQWDNRFVDTEELLDQIEACDIYLTPYPNLEQSTSGTLSYAVALGKAVVSTPYIHARELLADGVGSLVPPGKPSAISAAVNDLLDRPDSQADLKERAYARGRSTIWLRFAQASADLIAKAVDEHASGFAARGSQTLMTKDGGRMRFNASPLRLPCPAHDWPETAVI